MPGRNGTGPQGMGPVTGKGLGMCDRPNAAMRIEYRCGMGFGQKRGYRRGFGSGISLQDSNGISRKERLIAYKASLESRMSFIDNELENL